MARSSSIKPNTVCQSCNKEIYVPKWEMKSGKRLFCSIECRGLSMRKTFKEPCEGCGELVTRQPSLFRKNGNKRVFCSKGCFGQWRKKFNRDGTTKSAPIKRHVQTFKNSPKEYGRSCIICGYSRVIDYCHIIPARDGGTSHPDNIIALCPNHHRLMDRNLLTKEEDDIISDYVIVAWGSPSSANFPQQEKIFSKEYQSDLSAIPLASLLGSHGDEVLDRLNEKHGLISSLESSDLQVHAKNGARNQGV